MKIDFVYSGYGLTGGPVFEPKNLFNSKQGISGTELNFLGNAFEMARRSHDVSIYFRWNEECVVDGVAFRDLDSLQKRSDVAIAYHDARPLARWNTRVKMALHQSYGLSGEEDKENFADVYLTASPKCVEYHKAFRGWNMQIVPNSWDLGTYCEWRPVRGRIIFTTSVDRGFHRLLEVFPRIKEIVPYAHIIVFYRGGPGLAGLKTTDDITLVEPSSRNEVLSILSTASVMAYPCDTPAPCECWPMSVTEACATGVPVVLAPDDGIERIFDGGVDLTPSVKGNPGNWQEPFIERTVKVLTDMDYAAYLSDLGKQWAKPYTFVNSTNILLKIMEKALEGR